MDLFSIFSQEKTDIYSEIAYELNAAYRCEELRRVVCERARGFLPQHEADLMYALFTDIEDQISVEKNVLSEKAPDIEWDIIHSGYKGKTVEDHENGRKKALEDILTLTENDNLAAVKKFYEVAQPLLEAAKVIAYNQLVGNTAVTVNYIEVCSRLLKNGKLSLTEIVDCLPGIKMHDLYRLAHRLGIHVEATDKELARINEEEEKINKLKFANMKEVMEYIGSL